MSEAEKQLDALYLQGLGILSDAMARPPEGTHGGDQAKRDQAIGERVRLIRDRFERLHEAYRAFARSQVEAAKGPKK